MKMFTATILTFQIFTSVHQFQSSMPIPVAINHEDKQLADTRKAVVLS